MDKKIQLSTNVDDEVVNVFPVTKPEFVEFNDGKTLVDKMNNLESSNGLLAATPSKDGLMSKEDKAKLDNVQNYVHPVTHEATMITQDSEHRFITDNERITWNNKADGSIATSTNAGLMSAADKQKIDGLSAEFKTRDDKINKNTEDIKSWNDEMINKEYKDFSGKDITIENSIVSNTTNMIIKGRTLQNIVKTEGFVYSQLCEYELQSGYYTITGLQDASTGNMLFDLNLNKNLTPNKLYTCIIVEATKTNKYLLRDKINSENITNVVKDNIFTFTPKKESDSITLYYYDLIVGDKVKENQNIMILEGDWTNKSILEYFEGIKSFGQQENKISILSTGKNLFDGKSTSWFWEGDVGTKIPNNNINATQYSIVIPVKKGLQYAFGGYSNIPPLSQRTSIYFTDINKIIIKTGQITDNIVAPKDGFVYWYACSEDIKPYLKYLQIEEGTQATQYEPYKCDKKDILLSNLGFDEGLRGLNDINDELNSNTMKVITKIGREDFKDKNYWYTEENANPELVTYYYNKPICKFNSKNILCNKFPLANKSSEYGVGVYGTGRPNFHVKKTDFPTLESWKANSDDLILIYELADIVESTLDENINLKTFEERTYVSSDNIIKGDLSLKVPMNTAANLENNSFRLNNVEDYIDTNKNNIDKISKLEEGAVTSSLNIIDLQKEIKNDNDYTHYEGTNVDIDNLSKDSRTTNMIIKGQTLQNIFVQNQEFISQSTKLETSSSTTVGLYNVSNKYYELPTKLKANTTYTIIPLIDITNNSFGRNELYLQFNITGMSPASLFRIYQYDFNKPNIITSPSTIEAITDSSLFFGGNSNDSTLKSCTINKFNLLIIEGSIDFIPEYFKGIKSFGQQENKISILSTGLNIVDISKWHKKETIDNKQCWVGDGYLSGGVKNGEPIVLKLATPVRKNDTVTLVSSNKATQYFNRFQLFNSVTNKVQAIGTNSTLNDWTTSNFSTTSDSEYDSIQVNTGGIGAKSYIETLFIGIGSGLNYKSYKEDKKDILIKEPLRNVGDISDIMYEDNGQVKICRKSYEYTFTGDEDLKLNTSKDDYIRFIITTLPKCSDTGNTKIISNNFPSNGDSIIKESVFGYKDIGIVFCILKSKLSSPDVESFKAWLKANPTTIVYQLAEPTTEVLENCVDTNLKVYNEKTYINCLNNIKGELSFDIPNNLVTQVKDNTININNNYDSIKSLNDKTSNLQSAQVATALNVLELQNRTAMLSNGEINDYENYSGLYVECDNTLDSRTENMMIKGNTLQNLFPNEESNLILSYATIDDNIITMSPKENAYCNSWDKDNDLYKTSTMYSVIINIIENTLIKKDEAEDENCYLTFGYENTESVFGNTGGTKLVTNNYTGLVIYKATTISDFSKLKSNFGARICLSNNFKGGNLKYTVMILEGDWTNKQTPNYFEGIKSFGESEGNKISILSTGKNLANLKSILDKLSVPYTMENDEYKLSGNNSLYKGFFYPNKEEQYSLSLEVKVISMTNFRCEIVYKDGTFSSTQLLNNTNSFTKISVTSTKGKTISYIRMNWTNTGEIVIKNLQIEEGTTTSYEPYKEDKKDILIKEPLRSLPIGALDILKEDNGQVKINRNVKQFTITNAFDNIKALPSNENFITFQILLSDMLADDRYTGLNSARNSICSNFKWIKRAWDLADEDSKDLEGYSISNINGCFYIKILKSKLTTPNVDGFKEWLKANPTTIVYQLIEPTVEIVESIDINVDTYKNKTYITTDNNIKGVLELQTQNNFGAIMKNVNRCISKIFNSFNDIINKKGE